MALLSRAEKSAKMPAIMATPISLFSYILPPECIAQEPIEPRDHSRLMVLDRKTGAWQHRRFFEILDELRAGDLLVLNDSKVFKARLHGRVWGKNVEVFLLRRHSVADGKQEKWETLLKPGRIVTVGEQIVFELLRAVDIFWKGEFRQAIRGGAGIHGRARRSADATLCQIGSIGFIKISNSLRERNRIGRGSDRRIPFHSQASRKSKSERRTDCVYYSACWHRYVPSGEDGNNRRASDAQRVRTDFRRNGRARERGKERGPPRHRRRDYDSAST